MSVQEAYGRKDTRMLLQDTMQSSGDVIDPAAWLRETDIVSYDFPYAANLIAESFADWRGLAVPPFAESWDWGLLDFEGKWIEPLDSGAGSIREEGLGCAMGGSCRTKPAFWRGQCCPGTEERTSCVPLDLAGVYPSSTGNLRSACLLHDSRRV